MGVGGRESEGKEKKKISNYDHLHFDSSLPYTVAMLTKTRHHVNAT